MSSHHIVREKQEPALLILSLNHFTDEELGQLLEWSPTVIATPATAEQLTIDGIKVDYVITDNDDDIMQSDVKIILPDGQPLLQRALAFLVSKGYPAVNIITDELDLQVYASFVPQINLVVFCNQQKIYAVNSGFRKWKPAGEVVAVLNPGTSLQAEGLELTGQNAYKTINDGFIRLQFDDPYLFIAESY